MTQSTGFGSLMFHKGAVLIEEGTLGESVFLIKRGKVEVRIGNRNNDPRVLGILGPGDVVGEMSVFDGEPHMAAAVALDDVTVLVMSSDQFKARIESMDPIMRETFHTLIKRTRAMAGLLAAKPDPIFKKKSTRK